MKPADRTEVYVRPELTLEPTPAPQGVANVALAAAPLASIPPGAAHFIFASVRRLAMQQGIDEAEHVLVRSLLDLTASDRAYCLFYRNDNHTVWNLRRPQQSSEMNPGTSLTSLAAQHQTSLCLERAQTEPHYRREVDDPFGTGTERMLVQPVIAMGRVVAVLVLVRSGEKPAYQDLDRLLTAHLARESAGLVVHYLRQMFDAQRQAQEQANVRPSLFRQQALAHRDNESALGEVLELRVPWIAWGYRMLLIGAALGFLLMALIPVHQYASGSTIVRMEGTPIRATYAGTVERSHVVSGDRVTKGELLVDFSSAEQEALFSEIDQQYRQQLVALLEEPGDKAARVALRSIVARREQAKERIENLRIRATRDGVVADLRVQAGQLVTPGQPILTIVDQDALPTLVALLPGNFRPQLETGMTLRFRLAGYARADQEATIEWISREVVGPNEARRHLGADMADAIAVHGPVVLVRARLSTPVFTTEGHEYRFHNGMYGSAEVKIGSETILTSALNGN